jgi:enoyl-CoA hydratase/carnithine racemase
VTELVLHEDRGPVRLLILNRPDKRNALSMELTQALLAAVRGADAEEAVGAVVLTGAGPGFCAGADLAEMRDPEKRALAEQRSALGHELQVSFSQMEKPVVAAVNGSAVGAGAAIAIACDMVIMGASAKLGYPETRHGMAPTMMIPNLVRQVGRKAAFELLALGEPVGAERAIALGLANRVVPDAQLLEQALEIGARLAAVSRPAMAMTKKLFHEVADLPLGDAFEAGRTASRKMREFAK